MHARRSRSKHRRLLALPALLAVGLVAAMLPSSASAGTTGLLAKGSSTGFLFGGLLFAGGSESNDIGVFAIPGTDGRYFVSERSSGIDNQAIPPCEDPGNVGLVNCPFVWPSGFTGAGQFVSEFRVDLGEGDNRFEIRHDPAANFLPNGDIRGGGGPDRIVIGSPTSGPNFGRYRVSTGGGNDRITIGDHGTGNILSGGSGSDLISAFRNGRRDRVTCGNGRRDSANVDLQDRVSFTCERVFTAPKDQHPIVEVQGQRVPVKRGRARIRLSCPEDATSHCRGRLRILRGKKGNRKLGQARYNVRRGERGTVRVRVSRSRGLVRVVTREPGSEVGPKTSITQLRLRR